MAANLMLLRLDLKNKVFYLPNFSALFCSGKHHIHALEKHGFQFSILLVLDVIRGI